MVEIVCKVCNNKIIVPNKRFKMCKECSKEKALKRCRDYKKNNKENISNYNKTYKLENKNSISEYNKKYNIENREKIQKRQTKQHLIRRKTDPAYKMSIVLRNRFRKFYKGLNVTSMQELVGCSYENYIRWLEFNFTSEMSWENHGTLWHIDHVLLCHLFDHSNYEDRKICFNWKNTRPLLANKNLARKNIDIKDLLNHEIKLTYFILKNKDGYDNIEIDFINLTTKLTEKSISGSS
jgi:hypothetical protein